MSIPPSGTIRRAVVPAAGRGTRMRALAGRDAKEVLPVGGVPMLFHAVIDLVRSGIDEIIVVIAPDKGAVQDALVGRRVPPDAEVALRPWWPHLAACTFHLVVQPEPRGLAHAIGCAASLLGDEPFVCALPDNVLTDGPPAAAQLLHTYDRVEASTAALVRVSPDTAAGFGNCGALTFAPHPDSHAAGTVRITRLGAKGTGAFAADGTAGWRSCGLSVLTREFLEINAALAPNAAGEWDDVPILQRLARAGRLYGRQLPNTCYDAGNPVGYAAAAAAEIHLPAPADACRV